MNLFHVAAMTGVFMLGALTRDQGAVAADAPRPAEQPHAANPILPGYFADPSLVRYEDNNYIYATLDPWGDATLGCWESRDFGNWNYLELNWPTKRACTSPTSQSSKVWAPSVVRAGDGRFFMYVSVGSEVWVGVADRPAGPWRNALGDRPLIPSNYKPGYHMIDAEAFIDEDGQAYLYWGSGWNWTNGRCWAVRLKPDMVTFDGEVHDVTPANYFEAPFLFKHAGRYFLTYSRGRTDQDTYEVRYAVGDSPFGPFVDATNNPLLTTEKSSDVISPGHHAIFIREDRAYLLYHRQSVPFVPTFIGRQTCVDELTFRADGLLEKVTPTHHGAGFLAGLRNRRGDSPNLADPALGASATASGQRAPNAGPERALDDNYATRWAAPTDAKGGWLKIDLGAIRDFTRQEIRFEYPWRTYCYSLETSSDGVNWTKPVAVNDGQAPVGSPVVIRHPARARYLKLVFPESGRGADLAVIEWAVF